MHPSIQCLPEVFKHSQYFSIDNANSLLFRTMLSRTGFDSSKQIDSLSNRTQLTKSVFQHRFKGRGKLAFKFDQKLTIVKFEQKLTIVTFD